MGKLLDEARAYLSSVSQEQLQKDWEDLKEYNKIGPSMIYVIEEAYSFLQTDVSVLSEMPILNDNPSYNNPEYNLAA